MVGFISRVLLFGEGGCCLHGAISKSGTPQVLPALQATGALQERILRPLELSIRGCLPVVLVFSLGAEKIARVPDSCLRLRNGWDDD